MKIVAINFHGIKSKLHSKMLTVLVYILVISIPTLLAQTRSRQLAVQLPHLGGTPCIAAENMKKLQQTISHLE